MFTFWGKGEITLLKGKRHGFQKTFVESGLIRNARHYSENRPTSRVWKVLPKYGFLPDLGGKNGGVLSMRIQVNLDSSFRPPRRPGSAPIWDRKKGEHGSRFYSKWHSIALVFARARAQYRDYFLFLIFTFQTKSSIYLSLSSF